MIDEDVSRRTIALSIRSGKLTARTLAYALQAVSRKIQKEHRVHQTPHGRQSVKKLMAHGAATNSIELTGAPKDFDRVARRWGVGYAFYKTGPDKEQRLRVCGHLGAGAPLSPTRGKVDDALLLPSIQLKRVGLQ